MNSKTLFFIWISLFIGSSLLSFSLSLLHGSPVVNEGSSFDLLDWSSALNESTLLWKRSAVLLSNIVPVAGDWVAGVWILALDWWSVIDVGVKLNLGSIEMMRSLGVVVAWVVVGRDLTWGTSGNGWPFHVAVGHEHRSIESGEELSTAGVKSNNARLSINLYLSSIEMVWTLGVVITWVIVS